MHHHDRNKNKNISNDDIQIQRTSSIVVVHKKGRGRIRRHFDPFCY